MKIQTTIRDSKPSSFGVLGEKYGFDEFKIDTIYDKNLPPEFRHLAGRHYRATMECSQVQHLSGDALSKLIITVDGISFDTFDSIISQGDEKLFELFSNFAKALLQYRH